MGSRVGSILGVLTALVLWGPRVLSPGYLDWLATGDRSQHLIGWMFFRQSPWQFPIGRISDLLYPIGTNVAYTDSIPWLAISFKLISGILPETFQYHGLWLYCSYALFGLFAYLFLATQISDKRIVLMGSLILLLSPPLHYRMLHLTLLAQWTVLAAFWIYARAKTATLRHTAIASASLLLFCAGTHPYLWVMCFLILTTAIFRAPFRPIQKGIFPVAVILITLLIWWGIGYFEPEDLGDHGFGYYSFNLKGFFNPMEVSTLLPVWKVTRGHSEGFSYLGVGVLALLCFGLVGQWRSLAALARRHALLLGSVLALAIFAASSKWYWQETLLLDFSQWMFPFDKITSAFRASGRFIWPLYYLIALVAIIFAVRSVPQKFAVPLILLALGVQSFDLFPLLRGFSLQLTRRAPMYLIHPLAPLKTLEGEYQHLSLLPATPGGRACGASYTHEDLKNFLFLAAFNKLTVNSAYIARGRGRSLNEKCVTELRRFENEAPDADTMYILHEPSLWNRPKLSPLLACASIAPKGFSVCAVKSRDTSLTRWILSQTPHNR